MTDERTPPMNRKRPGNLFFILILACWLLFLYFLGGKGPG
jgi:hypothetical protein